MSGDVVMVGNAVSCKYQADPQVSNSHAVSKSYVDRLTAPSYWHYIYYLDVNKAAITLHRDGSSVQSVVCYTPSLGLRSVITSGYDAANACVHTNRITNGTSDDYVHTKTCGNCMFGNLPHPVNAGISIFLVGQRMGTFSGQTWQMGVTINICYKAGEQRH